MKKIFALMFAVALTNTAFACPVAETCYEDLTGYGYYDAEGHYCEYGGYWECGQWIQTVGYWECGEWVPAQYDPMLDVGYYDECGQYHRYGECEYSWGYQYGEEATWACDNRQWLEEQGCGQGYAYGCSYEEDYSYNEGYAYDCGYGYEEDYGCGYSQDCGYDGYSDCWIDVDLDADCISIVNNGVIILSAPCTCTSAYRGQELSFGDLRCAGIWNCSGDFYDQACGYVDSSCDVRCH